MYTIDDIRTYVNINGLMKKTKKREITDSRFYLFLILHYKFKMSLSEVQRFFKFSAHQTVISGLEKVKGFYITGHDSEFLANTKDIRAAFPFDHSDYISKIVAVNKKNVSCQITNNNFEKLKRLQERFNAVDLEETLNILIRRY